MRGTTAQGQRKAAAPLADPRSKHRAAGAVKGTAAAMSMTDFTCTNHTAVTVQF